MKLALISLAKDDLDGQGPIALLPLFAGTLLDLQIQAAQRFGCEKFIFLCPVTHGALLQKIDAMKQQGLDAEYVRSPSDLVQYASEQDHIVYIADGIIPNEEIVSQLSGAPQELLFTVLHAEEYQEFERIDLNQRWLGIVSLNAARLVAMIDIPDEWEIGSALLRTAVQADCPRAIISDRRMGAGAISHIQSALSATQYTRRKLKEMPAEKDNFLNRFLLRPLIKSSLPRLWSRRAAPQYLQIFALVAGLSGIGLAAFGYAIAALALLFFGSAAQFARTTMRQFDGVAKFRDWTAIALDLVVASGVAILLVQASDAVTLMPNIVIFALLLAHLLLLRSAPGPVRFALTRPDMRLVLLLLLVAAIFGPISYGIYAAALYSGLSLLLDRFPAGKLPDSSSRQSE
ncbi:hypothetical protein [Sphingorhabdus sp. YGSMI21]|uniref:hypothetical protein n=1 Tax=Sphingorhabdus sp. YGSMI21 TaxID=2077182 RepID=UPI000C1E17D0|nr:hypothetical protein [Sphingorhabdus sp. YGSMI21]ATW05011.1 hypothetical protein CHN51_16840 [Sphingorhabdus sp. YGSMI21]